MPEKGSVVYTVYMISHITGVIIDYEPGFIVVETGGIGYGIRISREAGIGTSLGERVSLWTYMSVRENAQELFGFATLEEKAFFEMLLLVPSIGPRSALAVLSMAPVATLKKAIAEENITYLTKVSGIGKKTAEKIVVTLKDRLERDTEGSDLGGDADVVEVLVSLGYSQQQARKTVQKIDVSITGTSERVKEALKILGTA
jgi:Holliday junction DNA helicase RuvA